ncbi:hypothetical protein Y032_0057g2806 [Ancylostoma ceylanicum]|uniref:Uncharacterized protein n=1 Tax=Ancylostoma ceylanicum TaxID=53326 RepID=A0A016U4V1_9BILA|nr:hypothetical protein Y032_0057g2806 [Ancylostoma ceylanicum]
MDKNFVLLYFQLYISLSFSFPIRVPKVANSPLFSHVPSLSRPLSASATSTYSDKCALECSPSSGMCRQETPASFFSQLLPSSPQLLL